VIGAVVASLPLLFTAAERRWWLAFRASARAVIRLEDAVVEGGERALGVEVADRSERVASVAERFAPRLAA